MPTIKTKTVRSPLWSGPCDSGPQGGITFSLLSRFISCRERFRIAVIEGLRPVDAFNHRLEFGNLWHTCEQALASGVTDWVHNLCLHAQILCRRYPLQQEQIDHWYNVIRVTFPLYVEYWAKHPDVISRQPLLSEQSFNVPYPLPSKRVVVLRGKWDSVGLVGDGKGTRVILQENKTKGDVREAQLKRQLRFDLQLGLYLVALHQYQRDSFWRRSNKLWRDTPIGGVRYNVVRRPLSGGKGSIVRHKPTKSNPEGETKEAFFLRLRDIIAGSPQDYFMRWDVGITPGDILKFRRECLDPILEQLCDWWEAMQDCDGDDYFRPPTPHGYVHWRHPFGVYDALNEGGSSDLDEYLETGSTVGLERARTLFPELEGGEDADT